MAPPHVLTEFSFPIVPRYAEVDQQGVVLNEHYLTWFDEAFTAFLDQLDVTYPDIIAAGLDVQVVRSEIDFIVPMRWRDAVRVTVAGESLGSTSLAVSFSVLRRGADEDDVLAVRGRRVVCGRVDVRLDQAADPRCPSRGAGVTLACCRRWILASRRCATAW